MATNGFSIKPLEVKLLAGEQKATESLFRTFLELKLQATQRGLSCSQAAWRRSLFTTMFCILRSTANGQGVG